MQATENQKANSTLGHPDLNRVKLTLEHSRQRRAAAAGVNGETAACHAEPHPQPACPLSLSQDSVHVAPVSGKVVNGKKFLFS